MPTTLIIGAVVVVLGRTSRNRKLQGLPRQQGHGHHRAGRKALRLRRKRVHHPVHHARGLAELGRGAIPLSTDTAIPTKDAILIDVNAVANFQIASETTTVDENGKQVKALENAAKNYLNQSKERMEKDVTQVLLGKLREVIGKTELKELMENRDTFAETGCRIRACGHGTARTAIDHVQHSGLHRPAKRHRQHGRGNGGGNQPKRETRVHQRGTGCGRPPEPA